MFCHYSTRRTRSRLLVNVFLGLCIIAVFTLEFGVPARSYLPSSLTFTINDNFANLNLPWASGNNPHVKRPEAKYAGKKEATAHHPLADLWLYGSPLRHLQLLSHHFSDTNTVFYRQSPQVSLLLDLPPPAFAC
jgi:hypothetical protein